MPRHPTFRLAAAALALLLPAAGTLAQVAPSPSAAAADPGPRLWLKMVGQAGRIDSTARVDESFNGRTGSTIDVERELGQDTTRAVPNLEFGVRIGERWRLEVEYLLARRDGRNTLLRTLRFDGLDFAQGALATSESRVTYTRVNAGFSLVRDARSEFGLAFGGTSVDNRLTIRARAAFAAPGAADVELTRADGVPMPMAGLYGRTRLAEGWHLQGRVYAGRINSGDGDGSMLDASLLASWDPMPNLRLSGGWRLLDLRTEPKLTGGLIFALPVSSEFRTRISGPLLQAELRY